MGSEPKNLREYLKAYSEDGYQIDEFRLAKCQCGSPNFSLEADDEEGAAKRVCMKCSKAHFICDSEEYWEDAKPEPWECTECGSKSTNIGVGFSLYEDKGAIHWLYVGVRCSKCGVLGCFTGWKIGYEPSLQLIEEV